MDALYLYKHSKHDDFEIRYSLRSLALHAPWVRKVWIYGDKPKFLSDNTNIIEHVPHEVTSRAIDAKVPVTNFFLMMFLSSLIPDLSSEYIWLADDYFLLKDYPIEEARKDRYLENLADKTSNRGKGLWKESLWRTYDLLIRLGYTGYNFEVHVPTYLTKKRVLAAYCDFRDFITQDRWFGMLGPTAILNHAFKQEKMSLVSLREENSRGGFWGTKPTFEQVVEATAGKTFLNFDDDAFNDDLRRFIMERYSLPSQYEKEYAENAQTSLR